MRLFSLKDIAKKTGVSITAVSNVLNRRPIRIGDEKRRLIVKTARDFNYRPNLIARSLKRKKAGAIGVVVPDMTTLHYPELIRLLEVKLFAHGYQTLICNSQDNALCEKEHLETLRSRFIDGLVIAPAENGINAPLLRRISESGTLVLCVDIYLPREKFHYVTTDGRTSARQGAAWLAGKGVSRVFYLGERQRHQALDDRLAGVKDAVSMSQKDIILCAPERGEIHERCRTALRDPLSGAGFFLESNRLLPGLLDAARELRIAIPVNLPIIGFDSPVLVINGAEDFASWRILTAPVPVIRQNVAAMAEETAKYLTVKLAKPTARFASVRLPAEIIFQESKT
ncbi:MAG: LacI family transcriptional regulator [Verrucomicrobia bacterium]|nr:LacI family transcriptional regulator [Verrucomicrobiota bacterium]MBU4247907.1 LacI family transcriptional regulator [Verrucomicrobiota bacterium]MBU4291285.1 LacI family transcriptional regulator [Verrucomicrobiota bacterium]MBU4429465.1 LacI family transcriptional regulator [Verrucomicrobiota bacterium]MBU4496769.1 LacI family transcriptional regulator [Verrucomicrobiota bacterium]